MPRLFAPATGSRLSDCQFFSLITLHSLQLIEDRPEAVRAARDEDARFASEEVAAPGEDHDVFLHVALGPVRDPFRHVSVSDEFVPNLEGVAAACTPIARAVRVGFDEFGVDGFFDNGDADSVGVHVALPSDDLRGRWRSRFVHRECTDSPSARNKKAQPP